MRKDSIQRYKAAWERQEIQDRAVSERLRKTALDNAQRLKDILVKDYRVKKIVLFGSVIRPHEFGSRSDIDIAVEGLSKHDYFEALGRLMTATDFEVDLKPIEDATALLLKRIKKGMVLYEEGTAT